MSYLKINNLQTKLDKFSLNIDSLEIKKGSFFGILGYSGAGKSTLLNLICGLEKYNSGEIFLDGINITKLASNKRDIAYVFQNSLLFKDLNVKENLKYILKAKGIKKDMFSTLINQALAECEANDLKHRDVTTLSGGEKQRVALSMALMLKPKLLILDEPFSNLDTSLKIRMREYLKTIIKKQNVTAIMVTHDKEDAFELFDEMILLDKGKILQIGTPKQIYENPNSLKSANYFGLENIFKGCTTNGYFISDSLKIKTNHKDCNKLYAIVPNRAIKIEKDGKMEKIKTIKYIEGRWKYRLENNLVFYDNEKFDKEVTIKIDNSKIIFIKEKI